MFNRNLIEAVGESFSEVKRSLDAGISVNQEDKGGNTPLIEAARKGNTSIVKMLLEQKANVNHQNQDGRTALMAAANAGHEETVLVLLAGGADVQLQDSRRATALMNAARFGRTTIVSALLTAGANVNQGDEDNKTALIYASDGTGNAETVSLLLNAGAEINHQDDYYGNTALTTASSCSHEEIMRVLLAADADITIQNKAGENALAIAHRKSRGTVKIIEEAKAEQEAKQALESAKEMKLTFKLFSSMDSEYKGLKVHIPPELINIIIGYLTRDYAIICYISQTPLLLIPNGGKTPLLQERKLSLEDNKEPNREKKQEALFGGFRQNSIFQPSSLHLVSSNEQKFSYDNKEGKMEDAEIGRSSFLSQQLGFKNLSQQFNLLYHGDMRQLQIDFPSNELKVLTDFDLKGMLLKEFYIEMRKEYNKLESKEDITLDIIDSVQDFKTKMGNINQTLIQSTTELNAHIMVKWIGKLATFEFFLNNVIGLMYDKLRDQEQSHSSRQLLARR